MRNKGIWYAVGAYLIWGLLPLYWYLLRDIPPFYLLIHRTVWSFVTLLVVLRLTRQGRAVLAPARDMRILRLYGAAALLQSINWLIANAGFIIEASLGYFIAPLLSVLVGALFLRERLRPWQWVAVALATVGVCYLISTYGVRPWNAFMLAVTFALYSLIKKIAPLEALPGLTLETAVLLLPALAYMLYFGLSEAGGTQFLSGGAVSTLLLIGFGIFNVIPLLLFAAAARHIPFSTLGILQSLTPMLNVFLGMVVFREGFSRVRLIGFGFIWVALLLFFTEGYLARRVPIWVWRRK